MHFRLAMGRAAHHGAASWGWRLHDSCALSTSQDRSTTSPARRRHRSWLRTRSTSAFLGPTQHQDQENSPCTPHLARNTARQRTQVDIDCPRVQHQRTQTMRLFHSAASQAPEAALRPERQGGDDCAERADRSVGEGASSGEPQNNVVFKR